MSSEINLDLIRQLRKDNRLIPFIGAGLSARFNLPTWSQLIDLIAGELGWDPEVFKLSGDFLQLADYYVAVKGSIGPLRSLLDKRFNPLDSEIRESRVHAILIALNFPLIYTTNYDAIIERAVVLHGRKCHVITSIADIALAPRDVTQVVKFHGTFTDDESLVLTETSYFERLQFESALDIKLRADILGKTLLFVGYRFSDVNIRYILYKLHKLRQRERRVPEDVPAAILLNFGPDEIQRTVLAKWDVHTVPLDPLDKDKSTGDFLESLH